MIKFAKKGEERGDCTAPYELWMDHQYTVGEFIDDILKAQPKEWGYIGIKEKNPSDSMSSYFGNPRCEYRYGKLVTDPIPEEYLKKRVISAKASGGWSRMDYILEAEDD